MNKFQEFTEKEWTVQATEATQFLICVPGITNVKHLWERFGFGYHYVLSYVKDNFAYWHYYNKDLKDLTEHIVKREKKQPGLIKSLIVEWRKDEKRFYEVCQEIDKLNLLALSDEELIKKFQEIYQANLDEWSLAIMSDAYGMYSENLIIPLIKPLLKEYKLSQVLPILTAPVDPSFATEESISFLKLLQQVKENPKIEENLTDLEKLKKYQQFFKDLQKHVKNFFWISNSYLHVSYLDEKFFAQRLTVHAKENKDVEAEIKKLQETPQKAKEEKEKLCRELSCSKELLLQLRLVEQFAIWQDGRKKDNLIGDHYLMLFLDELCRRKGHKKENLVGLTPPEFADAVKGEADFKELAKRSKESMVIFRRKGVKILVGEEAGELAKALQKEINKEIRDVRGTCASQGRVEGTVKIILGSKDISKMKKGDILVSSMTRPELVPVMKKAAAVVTDEGGVTCHAAIVSRELGIPCVIGTKIATKAFKDGDFVEVNANHGVVRKIKL